mmetsp:Transcript_118194/g.185667  ORF Transcript_118194/g.185667 Transcript_118194/m.185667 type:complete len:187 (+) Transcript_118194:595-1155(+)
MLALMVCVHFVRKSVSALQAAAARMRLAFFCLSPESFLAQVFSSLGAFHAPQENSSVSSSVCRKMATSSWIVVAEMFGELVGHNAEAPRASSSHWFDRMSVDADMPRSCVARVLACVDGGLLAPDKSRQQELAAESDFYTSTGLLGRSGVAQRGVEVPTPEVRDINAMLRTDKRRHTARLSLTYHL